CDRQVQPHSCTASRVLTEELLKQTLGEASDCLLCRVVFAFVLTCCQRNPALDKPSVVLVLTLGCQQTCFLENPLRFSLLPNDKYTEFTSARVLLRIYRNRLQYRSSLHLPCLSLLQRHSPPRRTCSHSTLACQPQSPWLAHFTSEPTHSSTMGLLRNPDTVQKTQFQ
ncbi:hypothetical protein ATANTOWER_022518, partial [Ataeniobius toweri]|nr:hypothetical protein [Ataeniobius toweri]